MRFFGLFKYRLRIGANARFRLPLELPNALFFQKLFGVLDSLAHFTFLVAAGLSLHFARRQSGRQVNDLPKQYAHDGHWRLVARGELDVRDLGISPRLVPHRPKAHCEPPQ